MATSRMAAQSAWATAGSNGNFLTTSYPDAVPKDSREAFDSYQEYRALDGTLASAGYWQYNQCLKDGFQATDEAGNNNCRSEVGNVGCNSYDPARAGYERTQQILSAGMERQMDIPSNVADMFASGMDLDEAYAKAGVPISGYSCESYNASTKQEPSATLVRGGIGAGSKHSRLAVNGSAGGAATGQTSAYGMSVAAAYKGDRVVSSFADGGPNAYKDGHPAEMPPPGVKYPSAKGAQMYGRSMEAGSGPSAYATMPTHGPLSAGLFSLPDGSNKLNTQYRQ